MTPETLKRWRASLVSERRRHASMQEAAERLGVPWRTYQGWEQHGVPKGLQQIVALAIAAERYGLPPYGPTNGNE